MSKVKDLERQLALAKEEQHKEQRENRAKLEPIYLYHTEMTDIGGIRIIGELQNKGAFDAHMRAYGSITDMPDDKRSGIEHVYTVDGYLISLGGGWVQPQLKQSRFNEKIKISLEEWEQLKRSVYPKRLYRKED